MQQFLSNYLFTLVFWAFFCAIIIVVISAGLKTPKSRPTPEKSPSKFVGRVRLVDMRPPDWTEDDKAKAQTVLEYLGGPPSAR